MRRPVQGSVAGSLVPDPTPTHTYPSHNRLTPCREILGTVLGRRRLDVCAAGVGDLLMWRPVLPGELSGQLETAQAELRALQEAQATERDAEVQGPGPGAATRARWQFPSAVCCSQGIG